MKPYETFNYKSFIETLTKPLQILRKNHHSRLLKARDHPEAADRSPPALRRRAARALRQGFWQSEAPLGAARVL